MNHEREYSKLSLQNDFVFAKAMRNPELCRHLLEVILQIKIERIEYPEEQKTIDMKADAKSVRLDVYVKDGRNAVYNIEMQTTNPKNLPRRSRYYQAMIDLNLIEKGENYNRLNKSYVIFICMDDVFGKNRYVYTFQNVCIEDGNLLLGDDAVKVFINPRGTVGEISTDLKNFFNYLVERTVADEFTRKLENEVGKVTSNEEWRREYMTLLMKEQERYEEGLEEGLARGRKAGLSEGRKAGLSEGRKAGLLEGRLREMANLTRSVEKLMDTLNLGLSEACAAIGSSEQEYYDAKDFLVKNAPPN